MLGIIFIILAVFSFVIITLARSRPLDLPTSVRDPVIASTRNIAETKESLLEQLNFRKVHETYQASYLDLIQKITESDSTKIDVKKQKEIFKNYSRAKADFRDVLVKVEEYEKDFKLKCFARMRSLILAVLFYDRKNKSRMTKFDPDKLIELGAIQEIPKCPQGGKYSIIYKDGRRLFNCSIHGTLKN
ncbi:MAG: hypothetical protein PHV05_02215 [Candidatus Riflebacteria bacterium]|nr:hypothetical protein [Candidatus Riflebacteria bacterium]